MIRNKQQCFKLLFLLFLFSFFFFTHLNMNNRQKLRQKPKLICKTYSCYFGSWLFSPTWDFWHQSHHFCIVKIVINQSVKQESTQQSWNHIQPQWQRLSSLLQNLWKIQKWSTVMQRCTCKQSFIKNILKTFTDNLTTLQCENLI